MKTLVVGDIHGCFDELLDLLKACDFVLGTDRLIAVGDLIDRGPKPRETVDFVMKHGECVLGNHEERMLAYRQHAKPKFRSPEHERSYKSLDPVHFDWFSRLPKYMHVDAGNTLIVHAAVVPGVPMRAQSDKVLLHGQAFVEPEHGVWTGQERTWWISKAPPEAKFWVNYWQGPERVLFGHTVLSAPLVIPHAIGLDTGACFGYTLTGVLLPEYKIVSVPARARHYERSREWKYEIAPGIWTAS